MPQDTRADEIEIQARVDTVKGMLVKAIAPYEIVRACLEKYPEWGVQKRQIKNYVYTAQEQLHRDAIQIDFGRELALNKARNELGMMLALKVSDIKTFASINKQQAELLNLRNLRYEPEWMDAFKKAGIDPDAMAKALFGENVEIGSGLELDNDLYADDESAQ